MWFKVFSGRLFRHPISKRAANVSVMYRFSRYWVIIVRWHLKNRMKFKIKKILWKKEIGGRTCLQYHLSYSISVFQNEWKMGFLLITPYVNSPDNTVVAVEKWKKLATPTQYFSALIFFFFFQFLYNAENQTSRSP